MGWYIFPTTPSGSGCMRGTILPICNITTVLCNTDATRDPYGAITIRRTDVSGLPAATTAPRHTVVTRDPYGTITIRRTETCWVCLQLQQLHGMQSLRLEKILQTDKILSNFSAKIILTRHANVSYAGVRMCYSSGVQGFGSELHYSCLLA